jgi:hypothetical protein
LDVAETLQSVLEKISEYIKLLRSVRDGKVFDFIPAVGERYLSGRGKCKSLEIWKPNRQVKPVERGFTPDTIYGLILAGQSKDAGTGSTSPDFLHR